MTEHEKRIREALEAGPTEGPFITFGDQIYRATDPDLSHPLASWNTCQFTMEGVSIDALYYAACNPAAIRALLADLDAVRGALSAAKDGGWLPIETAPKDGTVVILGRAGDGEDIASVVTTGHWQEAEEDGIDYMGADAGFVDEHYQEFNPGRSFGNPSYRYAPTQPTHWQPLPNPPKEQNT